MTAKFANRQRFDEGFRHGLYEAHKNLPNAIATGDCKVSNAFYQWGYIYGYENKDEVLAGMPIVSQGGFLCVPTDVYYTKYLKRKSVDTIENHIEKYRGFVSQAQMIDRFTLLIGDFCRVLPPRSLVESYVNLVSEQKSVDGHTLFQWCKENRNHLWMSEFNLVTIAKYAVSICV